MLNRRLPRKPFSEDDILNRRSYYTGAAIDAILANIPNADAVDRDGLWKALEYAADWYVNIAHGSHNYEEPPSIEVRRWKTISATLNRAIKLLDELPPYARANLKYAAERLAKDGCELPDFEPESIPLEPIPGVPGTDDQSVTYWPVEKQIAKSQNELLWLRRAITQAEESALEKKAPSGKNREDESKYFFCQQLFGILKNKCNCPNLSPGQNRDTDQPNGPLALILAECFKPLGIHDSNAALVKTYKRANRT